MLHFIKLGGSLITDKNNALTPRPLALRRLATEIAAALRQRPGMQLLLSHGSGSYGHVVGHKYQTRQGVRDAAGWRGFAETAHVAAQLNRLVLAALLHAGLTAVSFAPSALVHCRDGEIVEIRTEPVAKAFDAGIIPVVFGDVAFDEVRGGAIVSTEQVLAALAPSFRPDHLSLLGIVDGVFDADPFKHPGAQAIPRLRLADLPALAGVLGGSHGVDVTGGMASKIDDMARLLTEFPHLRIHLLSGEIPDHLYEHLLYPDRPLGTTLTL